MHALPAVTSTSTYRRPQLGFLDFVPCLGYSLSTLLKDTPVKRVWFGELDIRHTLKSSYRHLQIGHLGGPISISTIVIRDHAQHIERERERESSEDRPSLHSHSQVLVSIDWLLSVTSRRTSSSISLSTTTTTEEKFILRSANCRHTSIPTERASTRRQRGIQDRPTEHSCLGRQRLIHMYLNHKQTAT